LKIKSIRVTDIKADIEKNVISGYASHFDNKDSHGDVITKGAFKKTINENMNRIKVLWQHNMYEPIGKPMDMYEDTKGLFTVSKISQTDIGKKAMILAKDGVINEMSIGYYPIKEKYSEEDQVNYLKEVKLLEYSLVTLASNEMANITDVKNLMQEYSYSKGNLMDIFLETLIEKVKALTIENEPTGVTHDSAKSSLEVNNIDELIKRIKGE